MRSNQLSYPAICAIAGAKVVKIFVLAKFSDTFCLFSYVFFVATPSGASSDGRKSGGGSNKK